MKIVAIAGGNNSNIKKDGTTQIYEHEFIDKEIIDLSEKENPNILFISHASSVGFEISSYNKIVNTYGKMYSCPTKLLSIEMIKNLELSKELINWSDVIYVGGGNTKSMIELWKKYGFDTILKDTALSDKVLCGISAGANCWFNYSCSDYLQIELNNPNAPFASVNGISLINLAFNPHANYEGRLEGMKSILKKINCNGISLSNNMAICFVDDEYKLLEGFSSTDEEKFAILSYYKDEKYHIENIEKQGKISSLTLRR